jgi:hypothetical protein
MRSIAFLLAVAVAAASGSALAEKRQQQSANDSQSSPGQTAANTGNTRDWSKIDADHDGYVEPAEMEKYLQATWAKNGRKDASQDSKDTAQDKSEQPSKQQSQ